MDSLVPVLNANRVLDLFQLNILDNGRRLLWPLTVEDLLKAGKWNVLRFDLATTGSRDRDRNVSTHLR